MLLKMMRLSQITMATIRHNGYWHCWARPGQ